MKIFIVLKINHLQSYKQPYTLIVIKDWKNEKIF